MCTFFFARRHFALHVHAEGSDQYERYLYDGSNIKKKKMQNCVPKLESFVLSDSANQELSLCSLYKAACSELQVMFLIHYLLKYLNLSFEFWRRSD